MGTEIVPQPVRTNKQVVDLPIFTTCYEIQVRRIYLTFDKPNMLAIAIHYCLSIILSKQVSRKLYKLCLLTFDCLHIYGGRTK